MSKRKKRETTASFILELPLRVDSHSTRILHAHFEAARNLYNALLGEARTRLNRLRNSPEWQAARQIPRTDAFKAERRDAFNAARTKYEFSEYDLHKYATYIRQSWIGEHIDANTAQKLATRAFRAVERLLKGQAKKVRFRSKGRGIDSVEGKTNTSGIRFVLDNPKDGNTGKVVWGKLTLPAIIDWQDEVVRHRLSCRVKYVRIIRRKATSPKAQGADCKGYRYYAQLILEGRPYQKLKNAPGNLEIGLDIGPSSIAIVSQCGEVVRLEKFCSEIELDARAKRRLQRHLDRQRRANNPQNFDEKGRIKKPVGKLKRLVWHDSRSYLDTRRKLANTDRRLAAYRKSLHGRLANEIVRCGNTVKLEKLSYKALQKRYGRSVGVRAPGMFVEILRRTVARTAGTFLEFSTYHTRLSQTCHACGSIKKKPLSQRWHVCDCGITPIQRDLYSAWLASHIVVSPSSSKEQILSSTQCHPHWESAEPHLQAVLDSYTQRAKEGALYPRSFGVPKTRNQSQSQSA